MDPTERKLYDRVRLFSIDDSSNPLSFANRLARENGWDNSFALRVIDEYKKFMFMAVTAGHPVTPSEQVDRAWHLHLTYTRSYWDEFCGKCLGQRIHHDPTSGDADEQEKFVDWYDKTLESNRRMFGQGPPPDIWPDAAVRFGDNLHCRWVNPKRNWIVPKPSLVLSRGPAKSTRCQFSAADLCMLGAASNPFDMTGHEFLLFYAVLFVVTLTASLVLRRAPRGNGDDRRRIDLHAYEVACLNQGESRPAGTAIVSMLRRKILAIDESSGDQHLIANGRLPSNATHLETAVHEAVMNSGQTSVGDAIKASQNAAAEIRASLANRGLLETNHSFSNVRLWTTLLMGSVLAVGVAKIGVGLSRDKPVLFLVGACVVTLFVLVRLRVRPYLTPLGSRLLADLRADNDRLRPIDGSNTAAIESLPLATALFGSVVLLSSPYAPMHALMPEEITHKAKSDTRGFFGTSGDSGGGCGGGGCGGGGCGGGDCGGCGG